jgi:hypothetical protein
VGETPVATMSGDGEGQQSAAYVSGCLFTNLIEEIEIWEGQAMRETCEIDKMAENSWKGAFTKA